MDVALKQTLNDAGIKFIRILWCDNANIIRAKAVHIDYLEECIDPGRQSRFGLSSQFQLVAWYKKYQRRPATVQRHQL